MPLYSLDLFVGGTIRVEHDAPDIGSFLKALAGDQFIVGEEVGQAGIQREVGITFRNVARVVRHEEKSAKDYDRHEK